jgi:hypothetical protein
MILDKQMMFSEAQALTATAVSTNVVDFGATDSQVKAMHLKGVLEAHCQVVEAFTGGTSVAASIQLSTDEAFTSPETLLTTAAIPVASLILGYKFRFGKIPEVNKRYMRMNYTVVGTPTGGKVTACLALDAAI